MTSCEQVRELLDAYALGASEPSEAKIVEEHVADCVRCWDELSTGQRTAALIALTVRIEEAPSRLGQRIIAQAQRERTPKPERSPFWQRLKTWPIVSEKAASKLYLKPHHALGFTAAPGGTITADYVSDPTNPVTYRLRPIVSRSGETSTWRR